MYTNFINSVLLKNFTKQMEKKLQPSFQQIEQNMDTLQAHVLKAFQDHKVSDHHFHPSTGYGYNDAGRDTLENVYAQVFGAEAGLVRPQMVSGTHAITTALFGVLRPGDELLYISGVPYDTLQPVIGISQPVSGSLIDFGISFQAVDLTVDGHFDYAAIEQAIQPKTKVIAIQRSKGYADRPSLSIDKIAAVIAHIRKKHKDKIIFVDNCYGEFVETREPTMVGADLMAGSLIKNPGAGLVKTGGYIVGKENLVAACANRLIAPGIGREAGPSLYSLAEMYQGLFLAPHIVGQALKGALFTAATLENVQMEPIPKWHEKRTDIVQSVKFCTAEQMIAFCQSIQAASPVNSQFKPIPDKMPGYEDAVIMAAGTFVQGSSIELTADGPIRPPYLAFVQGGLTYSHVKIAILSALDHLLQKNLIQII